MHLQAAEDLRAEADRVKREARERAGDNMDVDGDDEKAKNIEATLKLAEILGQGGLPKIARLDVSCSFNCVNASSLILELSHRPVNASGLVPDLNHRPADLRDDG